MEVREILVTKVQLDLSDLRENMVHMVMKVIMDYQE